MNILHLDPFRDVNYIETEVLWRGRRTISLAQEPENVTWNKVSTELFHQRIRRAK